MYEYGLLQEILASFGPNGYSIGVLCTFGIKMKKKWIICKAFKKIYV